jgi:hypothetical protein
MEWLFGLAIIPVLLCALMCVVPLALATVRWRRRAPQRTHVDQPAQTGQGRDRVETAAQ